MTTRYLATIEGVFCAVPLRDQLSNLITTTKYIADRNIYAAVLTRQQWDKLREEYWATGRQCDHGRLVPDIDFIASDGKSFLDFEACRKHEADIAKPLPEENKARVLLDQFNAVATDQEKQTLAEMAATCSPSVPACYQYTESNMNDYVRSVIQKSQVGSFKEATAKYKTLEEMSQSEVFAGQMPDVPPTMQDGTPLAIAGMVPATDEHGNVVGAVGIEAAKHGYGKISGHGLSGKEPLTEEAFMNETKPCMSSVGLHSDRSAEIKTEPDGPLVTLTTDSVPTSLEDRMLVVVGSNYMNIGLVASLLKTDENAVRAVAESSGKFKLSGTGKSIAKTDTP